MNDATEFIDYESQFEIDWATLKNHLATHNVLLKLDEVPRQFSGGAANINFKIKLDNRAAVLRCPPPGPLPKGSNDVGREFRVISALNGHFPYVPSPIFYEPEESVIGTPFCISEFIDGIVIRRDLPSEFSSIPQVGKTLSEILVTTMAELHSIDYEAAGLSTIGKPLKYLERQLSGWSTRGKAVLSESRYMLLESINERLFCMLPSNRPICLVHNDFKLDNMILCRKTLTPLAVLDWDMCTLGDPFLELVILLLYWGEKNDTEPFSLLARMPYHADGWLSRRQVITLYCKIRGLHLDESALKFYVIFALCRFAVIYAQLEQLYSEGGMNSAAFDNNDPSYTDHIINTLLRTAENLFDSPLPW